MKILALNPGNKYTIEDFPAIDNNYKSIEKAKKALDAFDNKTYVAAFTDEGWLLSNFDNKQQLEHIMGLYKEAGGICD